MADLDAAQVFLDEALFTSFNYRPVGNTVAEGRDPLRETGQGPESAYEIASFEVSFPALLECMQIFGSDSSGSRAKEERKQSYDRHAGSSAATAIDRVFDARNLGMHGSCRFTYTEPGSPLNLILQVAGLTTVCQLATYETTQIEEIPLQRDDLLLKIIMKATWLHDAISELSSTGPQNLVLFASPLQPYLKLSSEGPYGSISVEFSKDPKLLEAWQIVEESVNVYQFSSIKSTLKAMSIASKVSMRVDNQGVLSLQFMVEVESGGVNFVDYRILPKIREEDDIFD